MDKIVIGIDDMANVLMDFDGLSEQVGDEYCVVCQQMNDACQLDDLGKCTCEDIVMYRYFVMQHFRFFMVKE